MNEQQAREQGLEFTGAFGYDKPKLTAEAAELRKQYKCRAVLVTVKPSPLSRGHHGTGWSIYAEPKVREVNRMKFLQHKIIHHAGYLRALEEEHAQAMKKALEEIDKELAALAELEVKYPAFKVAPAA